MYFDFQQTINSETYIDRGKEPEKQKYIEENKKIEKH